MLRAIILQALLFDFELIHSSRAALSPLQPTQPCIGTKQPQRPQNNRNGSTIVPKSYVRNMDTVFTDMLTSQNSTGIWPVSCDRTQLLFTLRLASRRANQSGHAVLASFNQPVEPCDSLRIFLAFTSLDMGERFFWELPTERRALAGVGAATTIKASDATRFISASAAWRHLQKDAVIGGAAGKIPSYSIGPTLFGGFAFDPLRPSTELWHGFPSGLLVLPKLLFSVYEGYAALTINTMVQPNDDVEYCAQVIIAQIERLHAAVEDISPQHLQERASTSPQYTIQDSLPAAAWQDLVSATARKIQQGTYDKVVLARSILANSTTGPFDVDATLYRLRNSYPGAYIFAMQRGERYFVGATPERLLRANDGQLLTAALAGSYPRGATEQEDNQLGSELLQSAKNKGEHEIVVATIRAALEKLCSQVWVSEMPQLLKLKNIQHLKTPIVGTLLPGHNMLDAIQQMHPTPAVGGFPGELALTEIRSHEQLDRGWYAGPIGWVDANGDGEFAVALRSALLDGNTATLFAGCGIVADSQPESEYAESCLKFNVMLRGLSGED